MHRIDTSTAQADKFGAGKNGFTGGNPQTGQLPTALDEDFFDAVQEELCSIIEGAGLTPAKGDNDQVLTALKLLLQPISDSLTAFAGLAGAANKLPYFTAAKTLTLTNLTAVARDILAKTTVAEIRTYLGLGDGAVLPGGVPVPWPTATPPSGWLKCNGASFTAAQYPKLAIAYPGQVLPDLRGQFLRGWDDGKGVDAGRSLLSLQSDAIRNIYGNFLGYDYNGDSSGAWTGAFVYGSTIGNQAASTGTVVREVSTAFSAANVVPTAAENRPVNIAFNFIVKAE